MVIGSFSTEAFVDIITPDFASLGVSTPEAVVAVEPRDQVHLTY